MRENLTALVVDDSTVMRKVIIAALASMGIPESNITQASDGVEAVELVKSTDFGIVLMDWNMPNMLGIDAVAAIRALGKKTPILMVTTEGERTNVIKAIQTGANNYLVKPFNSEDLREKVEQMLA